MVAPLQTASSGENEAFVDPFPQLLRLQFEADRGFSDSFYWAFSETRCSKGSYSSRLCHPRKSGPGNGTPALWRGEGGACPARLPLNLFLILG
jgi:hypothetical protein